MARASSLPLEPIAWLFRKLINLTCITCLITTSNHFQMCASAVKVIQRKLFNYPSLLNFKKFLTHLVKNPVGITGTSLNDQSYCRVPISIPNHAGDDKFGNLKSASIIKRSGFQIADSS